MAFTVYFHYIYTRASIYFLSQLMFYYWNSCWIWKKSKTSWLIVICDRRTHESQSKSNRVCKLTFLWVSPSFGRQRLGEVILAALTPDCPVLCSPWLINLLSISLHTFRMQPFFAANVSTWLTDRRRHEQCRSSSCDPVLNHPGFWLLACTV